VLDYLMNNYARLPVAFERGEGVHLWDTEGRRYLDAVAGIAVCGLGHAHPAVSRALCDQAARLVHTSNLYRIPLQETLAQRLTGLAGMERAFFCNSGAEANEAAIKLARLHGHRQGIPSPHVVVTDDSFHGRTLATLSATGNRKVQAGFEPLVQGFVRVPYNDLTAVSQVGQHRKDVAAVLVEPVQGEGGIQVPDPAYLAGLRAICDAHGWLFMADEIQTGLARTGRWFAYQHGDGQPDVLTLAKGLGNGVPVGACLARGEAAELFQPGSHGSTFGGNPLAMAAALAVTETIEAEALAERAATLGEELLAGFRRRLEGVPGVIDIRGLGLMLAIELDRPCAGLVDRALAQGLLINVTAQRSIRLLPPLILEQAQAAEILETLCALVQDFLAEPVA
jgi:acetylornithine aminotransferase